MTARAQVSAGAAVLLVLLAGCTSGADRAAGGQPSTGAPAVSASPAGGPSATGDQAGGDPSASPSVVADAPVLTLQGDGLGLLAADDSVAPLPFLTSSVADVQQAVEDAIGPVTELPLPACPQGPRTALQVDGFTVLLDGDRFVGWTDVGAPDRSVTTAEGIGVGSRLSELRSAVPDAQVGPDAGAATTFTSAGGLSGGLSGVDPAATVTSLSAGQTCPGA